MSATSKKAGLLATTFMTLGLTGCSTMLANWSTQYDYEPVKTDTGWRVVPNKEKRFKELQDDAFKVIAKTNQIRAEHKLPPLRYDPDLAAYAFIRAKEIEKKPSHERPDGSEFADAFTGGRVAENIERNFGGNPAKDWAKAKDAEDKVLSAKFTRIGVGHYRKSLKDFLNLYTSYWAQILADDNARVKYFFENRYAEYKPAFFHKHEREAGLAAERAGAGGSLLASGALSPTLRQMGDSAVEVIRDASRPDNYKVVIPNDEVNALGQTISDLVRETNRIRKKSGYLPLNPVESLNAYALARSREIASGHVDARPDGSDVLSGVKNAKRAAENALATDDPRASEAVRAWLRDPSMAANVIDADFGVLGAGVSKKDGRYYWSGIFATEGARSDYEVENGK